MTTYAPVVWILFNILVVLLLALDAFVLSPRHEEIKIKRALVLAGFWVFLAFIFNAGIYFWLGTQRALEFLTGYVIEQSLSIDNLFVFLFIFAYFKVPALYQRKVLFWGIIGAQVMRMIFILAGIALLNRFHWFIYFFGAFLVIFGVKLFWGKDKEIDPQDNIIIKVFRRCVPVTDQNEAGKFLVKKGAFLWATPLLIVLIVVETTDLIFAIDSIPAVLAVTKDPFIAYSSNIFAILGLRAIYFALAGLMALFHHLHYGLGLILIFVGAKMAAEDIWHLSIGTTLGFIMITLLVAVAASLLFPLKEKQPTTNF